MKAPFTYYGGKAGMSRLIVSLMPAHRVYVEPFAGSLAVLFAKPSATHEIVNDLDGAIVNFFRVLRDRPDELEAACRLTPYARAEYEAADLEAPFSELELARRFWIRVNQSFAKTAGRKTGWSVTTSRTQSTAMSVRGRIDRFHDCAERLSRVQIECCDAPDLVKRLATRDTLIYADPPYDPRGRTTRNARPKDYRHDSTPEMHERLAVVLHETPATVLLSGYPTALYDTLYGDWDHRDVAVTAHSSNAATSTRSARTERIWSNRPMAHVQDRLEVPDELPA